MKQKRLHYAIPLMLGLAPLYSTVASAEIKLNGFASVRGTYVNDDFGLRPFPDLPEDGEVSFKDESVFGVQARSDLGDGLSATIQFVAEGREDFDVEARWAYLSYKLDNRHTVNVGRLANPIFYQSEYEIVGYAHNFGRLPKSVYFGFDFNVFEGISLDSKFELGDYNLDTKVAYGSWDGHITVLSTGIDESIGLDDITVLRAALSKDWWTVYTGGFVSSFTDGTLNTFLRSTVAPGSAVALANGATEAQANELSQLVEYLDKDATYWYAGFNIDYNNIIVDFERVKYEAEDTLLPETEAWYAAVGYRFDEFVVTARREFKNNLTDYGRVSSIEHPILNAVGRGVHDVLSLASFDGYGLSLRYDFNPSAAFKFDYFRGEMETAQGLNDYSVLSMGVDVIF